MPGFYYFGLTTNKNNMLNLIENWIQIALFPNYEVSDLGRVRRIADYVILRQRLNTKKYCIVGLRKDGKQSTLLVHRLVAIHFIPNPENKPEVNHKKGIKIDNRASELEWATRSENEIHSIEVLGKQPGKRASGKDHHKARGVACEEAGVIIKVYESISKVALDGFSPCMVAHCCRGIKKTHKGFIWRFTAGATMLNEIERIDL